MCLVLGSHSRLRRGDPTGCHTGFEPPSFRVHARQTNASPPRSPSGPPGAISERGARSDPGARPGGSPTPQRGRTSGHSGRDSRNPPRHGSRSCPHSRVGRERLGGVRVEQQGRPPAAARAQVSAAEAAAAARSPLSCGSGSSSAGRACPRNCDELCERFCRCARRTDLRVKPSTFSAAEMAAAAAAAPAGDGDGDGADDIAAGSGQGPGAGAGAGGGDGRGGGPRRPPGLLLLLLRLLLLLLRLLPLLLLTASSRR